MSINLQSCMLSIRWWQKKHPGIQTTFIIIYRENERRKKNYAYTVFRSTHSTHLSFSQHSFWYSQEGLHSYKILFLANLPIHSHMSCMGRWRKQKKCSTKKHNILLFWPNKCRENDYAVIVTQFSFMVFQILLTASHLMVF